MTLDELSDLLRTLEPDRLLTKAGISFWLAGNGIEKVDACLAYCEAKGLLYAVERGGVKKWYREAPVEGLPIIRSIQKIA